MAIPSLDERTLRSVVEAATAAPSMHNAQPWRFSFHRSSGLLQLRSDFDARAMPHADPDNRAGHIGCGAALFNLRVAAAHLGWNTDVRLLPEPGDQQVLAAVRFSAATDRGSDIAALYPAIHQRHTSRFPFTEEAIPDEIRDGLCGAARLEGARLVFPAPWHLDAVLDLVQDAEGRDAPGATESGVHEDMVRWSGDAAETTSSGIPTAAFGPRKRDGKAPARDFAGRRTVPGRATATFETTPQLAVLGTRNDRPFDWLCAGQALERVLLQATLDGLATALTSQPLEWDDLRWAVRDPRSRMGHVHMVLRLGYGPPGLATPRRPVRDVLDVGP